MARVLFHIDLNAFYASAEELRHPEYKEEPIAVGSLSSRGVISTANYKAREYGVHSAMPTSQAKALCPDLILVPGDYAYYRSLSAKFFDYLRQYSGMLEVLSVDECFLDVTEPIKKYKRPLDLAVQIQQGLYDQLGLKCSIGVAPTRFLAKMASDMRKPMGITVLRKAEIPRKLWPLPIEQMYGIGKKTVPKLQEAGIYTIGDLLIPEKQPQLQKLLGKGYYEKIQQIKGASSDALCFSSTRKSVSHSVTFHNDLYTLEEVQEQARMICRELCAKMQKHKKKGSQISVVMRDVDFKNQVRSAPLPECTNAFEIIYEQASSLFEKNFEPVGYRLIGVTIGSLQDEDAIVLQPTLFEVPQDTTRDVVSRLNKSFEKPVFMKASDLLKAKEESRKEDKQESA